MTTKECYDSINANYNDVIAHLHSESLVKKFAIKFIDDPTFENLCNALADEDYNEVFRAAHTLKGVSQNLSFTKLYETAFELTEAVRGGKRLEDKALFSNLEEEYKKTINALTMFRDSQES